MGTFILRRSLQGFLVVLGVTIVVFVATRMIGDPAQVMLPLSATDAQRAAFEQQFGLDRPLDAQFISFVGDLMRFDFGESLWQRRAALEVVLEKLPKTLELIGVGLLLATVVGIPLGALAAVRPDGLFDRVVVGLSLTGLSVPQFWLGLLLIMVFAVGLGWVPTFGSGSLAHMILPAITLAVPSMARIMMLVRSSVINELNQQYVRTAKARGMPFGRVLFQHAMRNALVPVLTLVGWEVISAWAGYTVVVETVFAWPGLGFTAMKAINHSDLFLLQAIVFVVAVGIVLVNIGLDVLFKLIDPRIKEA
ncbi:MULTISPECIES: ABC transporter permease [Roseobacteraceae]|uniref:ABC transporter permease n=1 Tax=Roseobacteraceae TaxID=2854170 RepID=UPI00058F1B42|nr:MULTISPECIES: ABC transporter permease [Roseobacteraceae]MBU1279990.1 ABC transporter permease [Alphaproteobacteria bacterium]KAB6716986.1 ABC transporter permease [Roseobacter sp. TSBP12]MBU1573528.1 ABC transporter permease [Alphaproteobacteria bacterium]MBU2079525.1 ABC transporter permease [Alphaproteobacteria bacterium]MBU2161976.1 ABC transporter permease [Alphaproteobacteria bacterium]